MSTFIIPAITPRYVQSTNCRDELLQFNTRVTADKSIRVLPLIIQDIKPLKQVNPGNPLWSIIENTHYIPVPDLQTIDDRDYNEVVLHITHALEKAVDETIDNSAPKESLVSKQSDKHKQSKGEPDNSVQEYLPRALAKQVASPETPDFLEIGGRLTALTPHMQSSVQQFVHDFTRVTADLGSLQPPQGSSFQEFADWTHKVSNKTKPDVKALEQSTKEMGDDWQNLYRLLSQFIDLLIGQKEIVGQNGKDETLDSMKEEALSLLDTLETSFQLPADIQPILSQIQMLGNFVAPLRPLTQSVIGAASNVDTMRTMTHALREKADKGF